MSSQPQADSQQEVPQDCLSCKIIGTAAFGAVGLYALQQSRRGQPGSPAARRVMAGVGLAFLAASYGRWNLFKTGTPVQVQAQTQRLNINQQTS